MDDPVYLVLPQTKHPRIMGVNFASANTLAILKQFLSKPKDKGFSTFSIVLFQIILTQCALHSKHIQCVALRLLISLHCTGAKEVKDKDRVARKCEDSLRMSFNIRTGHKRTTPLNLHSTRWKHTPELKVYRLVDHTKIHLTLNVVLLLQDGRPFLI